jgi:hypothetical protein
MRVGVFYFPTDQGVDIAKERVEWRAIWPPRKRAEREQGAA